MSKTGSFSVRMGDTRLVLGLIRFSDPDGEQLWRLRVFSHFGGVALVDVDASADALKDMRDFVNRALVTIDQPVSLPVEEAE